MATPEVYAFGTAFADQMLMYGEDQLDIKTKKATEAPWKRYSFAIDAAIGVAGTVLGVFGDKFRMRLGGYTPLILSILAGNHFGRMVKHVIEYHTAGSKGSAGIRVPGTPGSDINIEKLPWIPGYIPSLLVQEAKKTPPKAETIEIK